jgi:hypothetical protein
MAWNYPIANPLQLALNYVEIRPADAAGADAQEHMARQRYWIGHIFKGQRM